MKRIPLRYQVHTTLLHAIVVQVTSSSPFNTPLPLQRMTSTTKPGNGTVDQCSKL